MITLNDKLICLILLFVISTMCIHENRNILQTIEAGAFTRWNTVDNVIDVSNQFPIPVYSY